MPWLSSSSPDPSYPAPVSGEAELSGLSCPHPQVRFHNDVHQQEFRQSQRRLFKPQAYSLQGMCGLPPSIEGGSLQFSWQGRAALPPLTKPRTLHETSPVPETLHLPLQRAPFLNAPQLTILSVHLCPCRTLTNGHGLRSQPMTCLCPVYKLSSKTPISGVGRDSERGLPLSYGSFFSPRASILSLLPVLLKKSGKELKSYMCNCRSEAKGKCRHTSLPVFK